MKYLILTFFLISTLQFACNAQSDDSTNGDWLTFLQTPDSENMSLLIEKISRHVDNCDWGNPVNRTAVPDSIRQNLFDLIVSGNRASLNIGIYVEPCLDGGDLEDFYKSAGQHFDKNHVGFLQEMLSSSVPAATFERMLVMLPEILVDDVAGKLSAVRRRILQLHEIENPDFLELKKFGMRVLKEREEFLLDIQNAD